MVGIDDHKRPIYGVLTEPIRGEMEKDEEDNYFNNNVKEEENMVIKTRDLVSYIPKAHV